MEALDATAAERFLRLVDERLGPQVRVLEEAGQNSNAYVLMEVYNWNLLKYEVTGNICHKESCLLGFEIERIFCSSAFYFARESHEKGIEFGCIVGDKKKQGGTAFVPDLQQAWRRSVIKSNQVIGFLSSWRPGNNASMQPLWQLPESEHLEEGFHACMMPSLKLTYPLNGSETTFLWEGLRGLCWF